MPGDSAFLAKPASARPCGYREPVFSPSEAEIAYAKDVFAAIAEAKRKGKGAIALRGKMIDAPIVQRARTTLEAASEIEGVDYLA